MLVKTIVIIAFLAIIASLVTALFFLVKRRAGEESTKTAKALTVRITLSLLLFVFLILALATGLIQPHGIGANIERAHLQNNSTASP
ncbi:twin transmembrane helix small protein [Methylomonas paludis]|uniref:Twin transmembrane helix small protein n=1 Tax=Methylomonas paludis TaxID=1173101 RepID=A0A975R9L4_9GAMM|nr:twin transmembrane helix small protein [Methylomonas paludis]QWF70413.1 twin transmembrane helix small protein [Methylomonas paludis]